MADGPLRRPQGSWSPTTASRGAALLLLPFAFGSPQAALTAFAVVYGLDRVATVPPTSALATRDIGDGWGALVFAWIFTAHQFGAATAAWAAGLIRTETGDYTAAFAGRGRSRWRRARSRS